MQTLSPSQFRRGLVLMLDQHPFLLEDFHITGTAKTKHKLHAFLRNLRTGRTAERVFQDNEHVATADLEYRTVQYSYRQEQTFIFLDTESFEELALSAEQVGERRWFLLENKEYKAMFLDGRLLDIVLPDQESLKVEQTAAPQRSSSQTTTFKEAILEGGLQVMVPLFIGPGEVIRVDTRTRKYLGKEGAGPSG